MPNVMKLYAVGNYFAVSRHKGKTIVFHMPETLSEEVDVLWQPCYMC